MGISKNSPPGVHTLKQAYAKEDLARTSAICELKLKFPSIYPVVTVQAMRVLFAMKKGGYSNEQLKDVSVVFWKAIFEDDVLLSDLENLRKVMNTRTNLSPAQIKDLMEVGESKELKAALKADSEELVKIGVFGAPTVFVKSTDLVRPVEPLTINFGLKAVGPIPVESKYAMFFGCDRIEQLGWSLGLPYVGLNPYKPSSKL
eukprot:Platyproteum_vivax@DN4690_c0_g1_i2.p1